MVTAAARAWRRRGAVLLAVLAVLPMAWVASNLVDDAPQPLPAVLAVPPAAAGANAAYAELVALRDATSEFTGPPIACPQQDDCPAHWRQHADAVMAQLAPHAAFGRRCAAIGALPPFAEPAVVPPLQGDIAPHARGASRCHLWFAAHAVAAAAQGREADALAALQASDAWMRQALRGSETLVGNAVSWRMARRHWQAVQAVAAAQPGWSDRLLPLARPLAPGSLDPRRWMRLEAGFARRATEELLQVACADNNPWPLRASCRSGIGWLPRATTQALDRTWARRLERASEDPRQTMRALADGERAMSPGLRWRNSFAGQLLEADIPAGWLAYLGRAADVELHRATVALGLTAVAVPPPRRREWLAAQALDGALLDRLAWSDDGSTLTARPLAGEVGLGGPAMPIAFAVPTR